MTRNDNILDELFRSKLADFEQAPPSYVWLKIQEKQKAGKRKAFVQRMRMTGIAAAILLAFLLGWQLQKQRLSRYEPVLAEQESTGAQEPAGKSASFRAVPGDQISEERDMDNEPVPAGHPVKKAAIANRVGRQALRNTTTMADRAKALAVLPLVRAKIETPQLLAELRSSKTHVRNEHPGLTEKDLMVIEMNKQFQQQHSGQKEQKSWSVGALVTPAYSVNEGSYDEVYASNMSRPGDKQELSLGGGISVEYQTGRRWSIQSGIHYSRLDQSSGTRGDKQSMSAGEQLGYTYFNNKVRMQPSGNLLMNASAGVIEIEQLPASIRLSNSFDLAGGSSELLLTSDDFEQRFEYLEIPLIVRYQLIDKAWDMHVLGGMSTNVLVDNDVYLENGSGSSHIGKTKDMNTFNYSASFGFGMGYQLTDKIELHVEPRLKYYLQSLSKNPDVNFKPYSIGLYTGVSYRF